MEDVEKCTRCDLYKVSKVNLVAGEGPAPCDIFLLGEAYGETEEREGRPFVGRAGKKLEEILARVGLCRKDVHIDNAVLCRPPNNRTPSAKEIDACREHVLERISKVKPKVIVAMGSVAFKSIMERPATVLTKMRGTVLSKNGISVVPTLHPAAVLRNAGEEIVLQKDLELALSVLKGEVKETRAHVRLVRDLPALEKLRNYLLNTKEFAFDIETVSFDWLSDEILCVQFCADPDIAFVVPIHGQGLQKLWAQLEYPQVWALLKEIFESPVPKIGQNYKFDAKFLSRRGIEVKNVTFDTLLGHHLIDENVPHNLEFLVAYYLGEKRHDTELRSILTNRSMTFEKAPNDVLWRYGAIDTVSTLKVKRKQEELLEKDGLTGFLKDIYMPLEEALMQMELNGVKIDLKKMKEASEEYSRKADALVTSIKKRAGCDFSPSSVKQLREVLYDKLKLPSPSKTPSGQNSTAEAALQQLSQNHEIAFELLQWRHVTKLKGTFLDGTDGKSGLLKFVRDNGRLYPNYSAAGTVTGRIACREPNLQNIPVDPIMRRLFCAEEGNVFISADYRQTELRVAAMLAGDTELMKELNQVEDAHTLLASKLYNIPYDQVSKELRSRTKGIIFGLIYGRGVASIARDLGVSYEEAEKWVKEFFSKFYLLQTWRSRVVMNAQMQGYVANAFGRRRHLSFTGDEKTRAEAIRQSINSPVQGTAADRLNIATIDLHRLTKKEFPELKLLMSLHDALFFEVPAGLKDQAISVVKRVMEAPLEQLSGLKIPVKVVMGSCWEDEKGVEV